MEDTLVTQHWSVYSKLYKNIAIYGAGKYTKQLIGILKSNKLKMPVVIWDDHPDVKSLGGVPVRVPPKNVPANIDAIVVGTDTFMDEIRRRIGRLGGKRADMIELGQITDNKPLLEEMIRDMDSAPAEYKPTNYWSVYAKSHIPELLKKGLKDFRRREDSVLASYCATDLTPYDFVVKETNNDVMLISKRAYMAPIIIGELAYDYAALYGETKGALPLENLEISILGNPEFLFQQKGKWYTLNSIYYYLMYAYTCQFMDFKRINTYVELGSGLGLQAEILKKFYPDKTYLLFDIPPQLYTCQQYLQSIFSGDLVPYEVTKKMSSLKNLKKGKIYCFPSWKFPLLKDIEFDIFWNAASFQEMEPDIVANYLNIVNGRAKAAFLHENMKGHILARKPGELGVIMQTTIKDYLKGLSEYNLLDVSDGKMPLARQKNCQNSFWVRKGAQEHWLKCNKFS
jgi:putative sugar O-methyltransferase